MYSSGVNALLSNGKDGYITASTVLIRIANNILKNSDNEKYRSIRIDTQTFQDKLLPYHGALQCLMEMGFQEDNERFTLFMGSNLNDVKEIHDMLVAAKLTFVTTANSSDRIRSQLEILRRLKSHFQHSRIYENKSLQEKARSVIPVESLNEKAQKRFSQSAGKASFHHCLLLEVLAWFKKSFFTWTDAPDCTKCNSTTKPSGIGMLTPGQEDLAWGASRVEGYRCSNCSAIVRFPRYNHPEKLLTTRTGRCGEWANCFTLVCRSMAFEARHVVDWTDHVWTEVYIPQWSRWVHCDPCENACDTPLIYEQGWKKKLSLIVAASAEEIVDVTWRYSVNRDEVSVRRNAMFKEDWLVAKLQELNRSISIAVSPERKRELGRRFLSEQEELKKQREANASEYGGRTSGSLAWRLARGETRNKNDGFAMENKPIEFTEEEVRSGIFHLEYSSKDDEYVRLSNGGEVASGWDSLITRSRDMMRKEELDWKQAYLCRVEGSDVGQATWSVNIPSGRNVEKVTLRVESTTFESGSVNWLLSSDSTCDVITPGRSLEFVDSYKTAKIISIRVSLKGGSGDTAWQKSQLFRASTSGESSPSFELKIHLTKH